MHARVLQVGRRVNVGMILFDVHVSYFINVSKMHARNVEVD